MAKEIVDEDEGPAAASHRLCSYKLPSLEPYGDLNVRRDSSIPHMKVLPTGYANDERELRGGNGSTRHNILAHIRKVVPLIRRQTGIRNNDTCEMNSER